MLDRYTNSNLVYYKHNGDDEPYDSTDGDKNKGIYIVKTRLHVIVLQVSALRPSSGTSTQKIRIKCLMPNGTCSLQISLREVEMFKQSFSFCFYGEELFCYLLALIKNVVSKH